jgi:hypothetical protein
VFRLDLSGGFAIKYTFSGGDDGSGPEGPLVLGVDGKLYGATGGGG